MTTQDFASILFEVQTNIHIAHLQTKSYAQHMALGGFYEDIEDLKDRFIETYQGKYGIVNGYKSFNIKENLDPITYLNTFAKTCENFRGSINDGWLQQICDDIIELTYSTLYKLRNLK